MPELSLITPDWPAPDRVHAAATTRDGGCSGGPFTSLNLAHHVGDASDDVERNRQRVKEMLGYRHAPAWLSQVHGTRVVLAESVRAPEADASYTGASDLPCAVMVADCLPLLICDRSANRVAAAHAGWRGLAAGVIEATLAQFSAPAEVLVWLGPAIGPCHYEVGDEVRAAFAPETPGFAPATRSGHWMMDLAEIARWRLANAGVSGVFGGDFCTYCDEERFFSYRRDGTTGRNAALIWLE